MGVFGSIAKIIYIYADITVGGDIFVWLCGTIWIAVVRVGFSPGDAESSRSNGLKNDLRMEQLGNYSWFSF